MPLFALKPIRRYLPISHQPSPSNIFCECSLKFRTYEQKTKTIFFIFFPVFDSQMLLNPVYRRPSEAASQVTETREQMYYNEGLLQNYTALPAYWDTLTQRGENAEQFQQEAEQSTTHLYYIPNPLSVIPKTNRREKNRERESRRQQRLREAFDVLRTVIPDYFSEREPGDRLTRIRTLRLATKYIALLRQLLEKKKLVSSA